MARKLTTPDDVLVDIEKASDELIKEIEKELSTTKTAVNKNIIVFVYYDFLDEVIENVCKEYRKAGWSSVSYVRDKGHYGEEEYFHIMFTFKR